MRFFSKENFFCFRKTSPPVRRVLSTFPRSGTHWLKNMIGEVMGVGPLEQRLRDPEALRKALEKDALTKLCYDHFAYDLHGTILDPAVFPGLRIVLLYRNPLDTLISQFYVKAHKGRIEDPGLGPVDNLKKLLRNPRWMKGCLENIRVRVLEWLKKEWVHPVRYEDLVADTGKELAGALDFLKIRHTPDLLARAIQKNSFEVLSKGRARGQEDVASHYRKGVPGEWKKAFSHDDLVLIRENLGDALRQLGYFQEIQDLLAGERSSRTVQE